MDGASLSSVFKAKALVSGSPLRGVRNDEQDIPAHDVYRDIHLALLSGLPTNVARKDEQGLYRGTRERKFKIFPGSALAK